MSISYTIDKSLKRITVLVEGDYTNDDLKSFTERVWSNPVRDGISGFYQLCLHDNASYIGSNMDIVELAEYRNKFDAQDVIGKTALVYSESASSGYAAGSFYKEARHLVPNASEKIQTFKNVADAIHWLEQ